MVLYRATWACEGERKAQLPEPKKRDLQSEAMAARRDLGNQGNEHSTCVSCWEILIGLREAREPVVINVGHSPGAQTRLDKSKE